MSNLGWLFYKGYYRNLTNDDYLFMLLSKDEKKRRENEVKTLDDKIDKNVFKVLNQTVTLDDDEMLGNTHFKATTTYPGLILGSGNAHELPDVKGQAILGFSFDYTSGLPIIAGSSVKGVIRSAFKHWEYIAEYTSLTTKEEVESLDEEIFDNGDVFFDAVVTSNGKILGDDYITPHGDALKNPIPLRFIKVLPNVSFRFDFELKDGVLTKEEKTILFAEILSDLGIGAKTNVGYGKFTSDLVSKAKLAIESQKEDELKKEQEREENERAENEAKALASLDSNIEKIKVQIKDFTKKETKDIYDVVVTYELDDTEKKELIAHLKIQIGEKPKPKNKAPIKWAIKIYELLGE
jgi:CRISPR-associated protein Cmr6